MNDNYVSYCGEWISAITPPQDDVNVWVWDGVQVSEDSYNRAHADNGVIVVQDDGGNEHLQPPTGWWFHYGQSCPVICWMPIPQIEKPKPPKLKGEAD